MSDPHTQAQTKKGDDVSPAVVIPAPVSAEAEAAASTKVLAGNGKASNLKKGAKEEAAKKGKNGKETSPTAVTNVEASVPSNTVVSDTVRAQKVGDEPLLV